MTVNIDFDKFPPQKSMQKAKAMADGNCFKGVCVVAQRNGIEFAIIAADQETLESAYMYAQGIPLRKDGIQSVAIFSQDNVKDTPK